MKIISSAELEKCLSEHGVSESIIDRVLRLNPIPQEGAKLRGIYRRRNPKWEYGWFPKGEILRQYSREIWIRIPRQFIRKDGRRQFVIFEGYSDYVMAHARPTTPPAGGET